MRRAGREGLPGREFSNRKARRLFERPGRRLGGERPAGGHLDTSRQAVRPGLRG